MMEGERERERERKNKEVVARVSSECTITSQGVQPVACDDVLNTSITVNSISSTSLIDQ